MALLVVNHMAVAEIGGNLSHGCLHEVAKCSVLCIYVSDDFADCAETLSSEKRAQIRQAMWNKISAANSYARASFVRDRVADLPTWSEET
ncbi:hypothetical protein BaRGS_00027505 [Batillaria attramentaria]|uniref:Uncharacterized protein n=1 Tax=Batillaria attramentaria TaxID=370345 RepID=A0ABD0K2P3_9CAEN